jgi:hypothetical protein
MEKEMRKIFLALVVVFIVSSASFCYAATWQSVATITGSGDQTTDNFSIPGREWRVIWSFTPKIGSTDYSFSCALTLKGERMPSDWIYKTNPGGPAGENVETSGINYEQNGMKDYYVAISTSGIANYSIVIESDSSTVPGLWYTTTNSILAILAVIVIVISVLIIVVLRKKRKKN